MRLRLVNTEKSPVYEQFLVLPRTARLVDASTSSTSGSVVISAERGMRTVGSQYDDPGLPGGMYVINAEHHPVLMIARDGNIYTPDPLVHLEYGEKNGYILISAYKEGHRIATVHYALDFFFTKK